MHKLPFQFGSTHATAKPEKPSVEPTAQPGSDVVFGLRKEKMGIYPSNLYARAQSPVFVVVERRKIDLSRASAGRTFGKRSSGTSISRLNSQFRRRKTDKF